MRRGPAGGAGSASIRRRPASGNRAADRVHPLLYPGDWLDRIHHSPGIAGIIEALLLGMSIFMMVKAAHAEAYPLPLFGELAQRSVAED